MKQRHNRVSDTQNSIDAMGDGGLAKMIVGTAHVPASEKLVDFIKTLGPGSFVNKKEMAELLAIEPEAVLGITFINGVKILISAKDFNVMLNGPDDGQKIDSVRLLTGTKPSNEL